MTRLLDGDAVRVLVADVAAALPPAGPQHTLIIVGGSLLAWRGLRQATEDVDTIRRIDEELRTRGSEARWIQGRLEGAEAHLGNFDERDIRPA